MTTTQVPPEGHLAYGWHTFAGAGLSATAQLSTAHLVPESQRYTVRGGTVERVQGPSLCGRRMTAHGARLDPPDEVAHEVARGERRLCGQCARKAGVSS